ncbi:MAG: hypothetical protein ACMXYD_01780 [Candidatus Woesearchaeota archaeon]
MKAVITTDFDPRLLEVFVQEDKDIGRASYTIEHDESELRFVIVADDATALRTVMNAITKLLSIWEDSKDL